MDFKLTLTGPSSNSSITPKFSTSTATVINTFQPENQNYFLIWTGDDKGNLVTWKWKNGENIVPIFNSIFHKHSITAINTKHRLSADQSGKLVLWDESFARIQAKTEMPNQIDSISVGKNDLVYISGQFSEVIVLEINKLSLVRRLTSRLYPDWVCSVFAIPNQVIGVTVTGILKVWFLEDQPMTTDSDNSSKLCENSRKRSESVSCSSLEDEVRRLTTETPAAVLLNNKFLAIISPKLVEFFSTLDFGKVCEYHDNEESSGELFCGGQFLRGNVISIWSVTGKLSILEILEEKHTIKVLKTVRLTNPIQSSKCIAFLTANCFIHALKPSTLAINGSTEVVDYEPKHKVVAVELIEYLNQVAVCYEDGTSFMENIKTGKRMELVLHPKNSATTAIIHPGTYHNERYQKNLLVAGCERGYVSIFSMGGVLPEFEADNDVASVTSSIPGSGNMRSSESFTSNLSSHAPKRVKTTWYTPEYTRLPVHMGPVKAFHIPPHQVSRYLQSSIVSISADNSVCITNLITKKVQLRCSHFTKPIRMYWKAKEDYLIVQEFNKTVSVWECEANRLERLENYGSVSEMIIAACKHPGFDPDVNCTNLEPGLAHTSGFSDCDSDNVSDNHNFSASNAAKGFLKLEKTCFGYSLSISWAKLIENLDARTKVASPTFQVSGNDSLRATQVVKNFTEWAKKEIRGENEVRDRAYYENGDGDVDNTTGSVDVMEDVGHSDDFVDSDKFLLEVLQNTLCLETQADCRLGVVSYDRLSGLFLQLYQNKSDIFSSSYITTEYLLALFAINNYLEIKTTEIKLPESAAPPLLDILARYWCHPSTPIRNAVKQLLALELERLGVDGRAILLDLCRESETTILTAILLETFSNEFSQNDIIRYVSMDLLKIIDSGSSKSVSTSQQNKNNSKIESAIELLGSGFLIYQPYFEFSKVLHSLFQLTIDLPGGQHKNKFKISATRALFSICKVAATSFVMTLSTEITRLSLQPILTSKEYSLLDVKLQVLKCLDYLLSNSPMVRFLQQVVEIIIFALDMSILKEKALKDAFPKLHQYSQVTNYQTKVAIGCTNGNLILYETSKFAGAGQKFAGLLQTQTSTAAAHGNPISCVEFSTNGKLLACYSPRERKISFWSIEASSIFGGLSMMGNSLMRKSGAGGGSGPQLKLKTVHSTIPTGGKDDERNLSKDDLQQERIVWVNEKTAVLQGVDGSEFRFMV